MDEQNTMTLILALQLQDIDELCKGKGREGDPLSDASLAIELYRDELRLSFDILADRRLGLSIRDAVRTDSLLLEQSIDEENIAIRDREMAYRLSGSRPQTPLPALLSPIDGLVDRFAKWNSFETDDDDTDLHDPNLPDKKAGGPSSSRFVRAPSTSGGGGGSCIACGDGKPTFELLRVTCGDSYCIDCINELFAHATKDESLFPPRCCRNVISLEDARPFLRPDLAAAFERTTVELSTPNRTYCHDKACSAFILPRNVDGDRATCQDCGNATCTICKAPAHNGDCPNDPALESLMVAASAAGYQQCHRCNRLVELNTGCNHMTCLCRAEFCYLCGVPWKKCRCELWQEERLLARAEVVAAREQGDFGHLNAAGRAVRVRQAIDRLRERHECDHNDWRVRQGEQRCEECAKTLKNYLLECQQCELRACVRCVRNRL